MSPPEVTRENYFSSEIQMAYMSASQFKAFDRCEAAALAELRGEWPSKESTALLVGSYVDAVFSQEMDTFRAEHPGLFKRDGTLKSEFLRAEELIRRMEGDPLYTLLMRGEKQVIRTGTIAGVPFKIKIDSLLDAETCREIVRQFPETQTALGFCDGAIVDQKVMRDTEDIWDPETHCRVPFAVHWGYDLQGAIYQAIEGHLLPFILAVGTKEDPPGLVALYIPDGGLAAKLAEVENRAPRYQAIKEGREAPKRCGNCPYCRATRALHTILDYREVGTW